MINELLDFDLMDLYEEPTKDTTVSDIDIDRKIERYKAREAEKERLSKLFDAKVQALKVILQDKVDKLDRANNWDVMQIKEAVLLAKDKRETKTLYAKDFLSGTVQLKKATVKIVKPELDIEAWAKAFPDYTETVTIQKAKWAELKANLEYKDGIVTNTATREDLTALIPTEFEEMKVVIK